MKEFFEAIGQTLISLLPLSPFAEFYASWSAPEWVSWLNWFLPVGTFVKIMAAWLVAIALYYAYSVAARWAGIIS